MWDVFLQTLPFFGLIGLGFAAARAGMFPPEGTAWLTAFVFRFALSAMLFRFAATLDLAALFDLRFTLAYLAGSGAVWAAGFAAARARGLALAEAGMTAHAAMTGNTGFLGVPMLVGLFGPGAAGPVLMVLAVDLVVFTSLVTIVIALARHGRLSGAVFGRIGRGLAANPMIVSMAAGLAWSGAGLPMPAPLGQFVAILGAAATPGALFAIGASLAAASAERLGPAAWLSGAKLVLHPAAVALACAALGVAAFPAGVMIAAAALPVAGNVYILASHYAVAPARVSAAILISTAISVLTLPPVIALVQR